MKKKNFHIKKMTKTFETEINDKHRLLDLNSDSVNFELDFRVTSVDKSEFQAIVLAKTELDKYADLSEIKMKNCPGTIKGSITASDNNHENYFLVLRKENGSILANVEIDLRPIEMKEETVETSNTSKSDNLFKRLLDDYFYHILFVVIACFIVYWQPAIKEGFQNTQLLEDILRNGYYIFFIRF